MPLQQTLKLHTELPLGVPIATLPIGDLAKNVKTGQLGRVVGYGHQTLNDVYQTTLKVLILDAKG